MRSPALLLALLGLAAPAGARELWTSRDEASALELRAFYKTFATGVELDAGLVAASAGIADAVAAARAALPPAEAALLPAASPLPELGATSAHVARLWGRLWLQDRVELQAGAELSAAVASDARLLGGGVLAGAGAAPRRRLVDLEHLLAAEGGLRLEGNLDLLALKLRTARADLTLGRQVLSWGSGRLWNPTDLASPFAPTDVDREVRRGVDALRVSLPLSETAQVDLLWLPQPDLGDWGGVARAQWNLKGFDVAPSAAKYVRDLVVGLDVVGDLGAVAVHAEGAYTSALDGEERFLRLVAGAERRVGADLVVGAEAYWNGCGAATPAGYLAVLRGARAARGEVFGAGRAYLGLSAAWQATALLGVRGVALVNAQDPSALLMPSLEYWAEQSVIVRAGAIVPVGEGPDPRGAAALTAADVIEATPAWEEATGALGLRSEYGAAALALFVEVGVYFL